MEYQHALTDDIIIYIPLCLYFNAIGVDYIRNAVIIFTFHYVSILICHVSISIIPSLIYIPLCLYFNMDLAGTIALAHGNLHSIMSLF